MRRFSALCSENWISRPRSSERCSSVIGRLTSRRLSSWATVNWRSLAPGLPETNTAWPTFGAPEAQVRKSGVLAALPSS